MRCKSMFSKSAFLKLAMQGLLLSLILSAAVLLQSQVKSLQKTTASDQAAQSTPSATPPTLMKRDEKPPELPPNEPVITVRGLCQAENGPAAKAAVPSTKDCVITVTRQQFDNLLKAFNPNNQPLPPATRRQIAQGYVEILVFAEAAKAAGVENSPEFAEVMRVLRLRTMADVYRTQLGENYRNPPQEEIEAYYKENQSKFESAKLSRIYIPRNDPNPQATDDQKKAYQAKATHVADEMQARAAKGEAIDKLQKEAYATLGIVSATPNTELNTIRRGVFPAKLDQDIFSHKAGEVVRSDDGNGLVIYHIDSLQTVPIETAKEEITREIFRRKMEEKQKELTTPVQANYNENYFGPPPTPGASPGPPTPNQPK